MLLVAKSGGEQQLSQLAEAFGTDAGYLVDNNDCLRMVPILRHERICGAYYESEALDLDVDAIHQGFMRLARERGAELVNGVVDLRASRRGQHWSIGLGDTVVTAPTIINAAGAWADEIAVGLGASPVGLSPLRRTAVLVDPPAQYEVSAWPAVMDADELYYFKPDAGKLLLSPADETASPPSDAQPDEFDIAVAIDRVQQIADLPVRRVNHAWAGLRTFSPDRLPVVGFDPNVPGLLWLAGQGGYGIQTAPALACLAASLALGDHIPEFMNEMGVSPEAISPSRFHRTAVGIH
jgi:D-arginine dehydrogenase